MNLAYYYFMWMIYFMTENEKHITYCKKRLVEEFDMKDLGLMHYFLGLEMW